jgi:hypothetical protein
MGLIGSAKDTPLDPALCKGLHGMQQTGPVQKMGNSQANSIDIVVIEEEHF